MKKFLSIILALATLTAVSCKKGPSVGADYSVEIIPSVTTTLTDSPITFTLKFMGGVFPFTYEWDFGDGLTGNKSEETVVYTTAGTKTVKIKVTDSDGVVAQAQTDIVILDKSSVPQLSKLAPVVKAVYHNAVTVGWDPCFDDYCEDQYNFVFADAAGNAVNTVTTAKLTATYGTVLAIGNLKPESKYTFKVQAVSTEETAKASSEWAQIEFTTTAKPAATLGAIFEEHFDNFVWGPDYFFGGYGFRPKDAGQKAATSLDEVCDEVRDAGTTTGDYFATFTEEFRTATGTLVGWDCSKIYGCLGFAKMGTGSAVGYVTTPALASLGGMKDITVTFKASPYYTWTSDTVDSNAEITVSAIDGGTIENGTFSLSTTEPLKWTEYSVTVKGATPSTKIKITGNNTSSGRYFIDDIVITEAASSGPGLQISPETGQFTSDGGEISFQLATNSPWEATGVPDWAPISQAKGEAGVFTITFTATKATADRSAEVTFSTKTGANDVSAKITLVQKAEKATLSTLKPVIVKKNHVSVVVGWDPDNSEYTNTTYGFEFVDAAGKVLNEVQSGKFDAKYGTRLSMGGLQPSTTYKFRVRTVSTDETLCESSPWAELEFTTDATPNPVSGAILEQHFDGFVWVGEIFDGGYGFRTKSESSASLDSPRNSFVNVTSSTADYFSTFPASYLPECGLEGWTGKRVYGHLGVAKMGTGSADGWIQTPALSAISGTQDIEVSFKISPFYSYTSTAEDKGMDKVVVNVTAEGAGTIENGSVDFSSAEPGKWMQVTMKVKGATSATMIKWSNEAKNQRYFLDDIVIK